MGGVVSLTSEAPAASGVAAAHRGWARSRTRHGRRRGGAGAAAAAALVARLDLFRSRADFPYRSDNRTLFDPQRRPDAAPAEQPAGTARRLAARHAGRRRRGASCGCRCPPCSASRGCRRAGPMQSFATRLGRRRLAPSANLRVGGRPGRRAAGCGPRSTRWAASNACATRWGRSPSSPPRPGTARSPRAPPRSAAARSARRLVLSALLDARHEGFLPNGSGARTPAAARAARVRRRGGHRHALVPGGHARAAGLAARRGWPTTRSARRTTVSGQPAAATRPATYLLPIARLGACQSPHPAVRLRANAGSYARLPTLFERYGNGGNIVGNPTWCPSAA